MCGSYQDYYDGKTLFVAVAAAIIVIGGQFVQQSMAQDLGQMAEQAKEKIGGALGQFTGGNQSGNQSSNQSGGFLGQLGEQARNMLGQ